MSHGITQVKNDTSPPRIQNTSGNPTQEKSRKQISEPSDCAMSDCSTLSWPEGAMLSLSCSEGAQLPCDLVGNLRTLWVFLAPDMNLSKTSQEEDYFISFNLLVENTNSGSSLLDPAYKWKGPYASKHHSENIVWCLPPKLPPSPCRAKS